MATLLELVVQGQLHRLDPALEAQEREWRLIYTSPELLNCDGIRIA